MKKLERFIYRVAFAVLSAMVYVIAWAGLASLGGKTVLVFGIIGLPLIVYTAIREDAKKEYDQKREEKFRKEIERKRVKIGNERKF